MSAVAYDSRVAQEGQAVTSRLRRARAKMGPEAMCASLLVQAHLVLVDRQRLDLEHPRWEVVGMCWSRLAQAVHRVAVFRWRQVRQILQVG